MDSPLAGIHVVDFTHVMAGPYCTHILCLLGARVTKIERGSEGDVMRHYDPRPEYEAMSPPFCAINAGKKSIALNLKTEAGKEAAQRLINSADVVVENFRPGVLDRLGLGYGDSKKNNPSLIYCSISGFGQQGPLKNNPAYDHIVQAMSGIMSLTGEPGSKHTKVGFPVLDTFAGYTAAMAIMTALFQRERENKKEKEKESPGGQHLSGQYIDVAMLDAALNLMISMVAPYLIAGDIPEKVGNRGFNMSPTSDTFTALDSEISIGANTQKQYEALCKALEREDLITDSRFITQQERIINEKQLQAEIEQSTCQRHALEWEQTLNDAGVPSAAIRDITEIIQHPHLDTRGLKIPMHSPTSDAFTYTLSPGFAINTGADGLSAPPKLGEHSAEILASLGYSEQQIRELQAEAI